MATFGSYKGSISPIMSWYANYSYSRTSNSNVRVTLTVTGEITNRKHSSWMGTGNNIVITATVGGSSQTYEIKSSSSSWYGDTNNPRSHAFTFDVASSSAGSSISVSYSVKGSGYTAAATVPKQSTSFLSPALLYTASKPSASSGTIGSSVTINTNRTSTALTHTITYKFGSATGTIATGVGASCSWSIPTSLGSQIPNSVSGTCTITCTTYAGSTLIGTATTTMTLSVPSTAYPTCNLTLSLVPTSEPSSWGVPVQGYTKVKCVSTASGAYGSTIKAYRVEGGGYVGTSSNYTTGVINSTGVQQFKLTVTDSRGRSSSKTVSTASFYSYGKPVLSSVNAFRANSSGASSENGTYIRATAKYTYSSVNGKNTVSCSVAYKKNSDASFSSASSISSGGGVTLGGGAISGDFSYVVRFTIKDGINTITYDVQINASTIRPFHIKKGGKGVAFGKVAEIDELVDCAWPLRASGLYINEKSVSVMEGVTWTPRVEMQGSTQPIRNSSGNAYKIENIAVITYTITFSQPLPESEALWITDLPYNIPYGHYPLGDYFYELATKRINGYMSSDGEGNILVRRMDEPWTYSVMNTTGAHVKDGTIFSGTFVCTVI